MKDFIIPDLEKEFGKVRLKNGGGVFASASPNYQDAIFGRDSLETAEDVLEFYPQVAKEVLLTLAGLQGATFSPLTEEEPGKIHHEYRALIIDGRKISESSQKRLQKLSEYWGGTSDELRYYGSVDATPLFVRLAVRYCLQEGDSLLNAEVIRHDGVVVTLRQSVMAALDWLMNKMAESRWGLVEFCRVNAYGHTYQVWKDGTTGYLHVDGKRANYSRPIAALEVQGYTYDALIGAGEMGTRLTHDEVLSMRWLTMAKQLQGKTLRHFWMPEAHFMALAVDKDSFGQPRQVATRCSNAGLLLESRLLDDLSVEDKKIYVSTIVSGLYSGDFLTDVGIRCRALQHETLVNFADYHGVWAVWAKESYDIAKGFRRQGFGLLADQLEWRILNGIRLSGKACEFWYVTSQGQVVYDPWENRTARQPRKKLIGSHIAEDTQSWTVSAGLAIERRLEQGSKSVAQDAWQYTLEQTLLGLQPQAKLLQSAKDMAAAYPEKQAWHIDLDEGRKRRRDFKEHNSLA